MKASKSPLRERICVPTGLPDLDTLMGGGVFMRRIFQISGRYSCGKSTIAALVVAEAQKMGYEAAWLDVENRFNFDYFGGMGVDLDKLDYENGKVCEDYFECVHRWIEKHSGIVVLDSVAALLTRNESEKEDGPSVPEVPKMIPNFLKKVTNELASAKKPSALIILNHEKIDFDGALKVIGGRSVEHFVTQWLRLRRMTMKPIKKGAQQIGDTIEASMKKDQNQYKAIQLELIAGEGFRKTEGTKIDIDLVAGSGFIGETVIAPEPKKRGRSKKKSR